MDIGDIKRHYLRNTMERFTTSAQINAKKHSKKTRHPIYTRNHHNMMRVKDTNINTQVPNALLTP